MGSFCQYYGWMNHFWRKGDGMEDRLADLERRMGDWEVNRARAQRRANFWFTMLTLVVIASPFLVTPPEDDTPSPASRQRLVSMLRLRFGCLWRTVYRMHRPGRPVSARSAH
jgi:hypothetical protein